MNQQDALDMAKTFLDTETDTFDNAKIELGNNQSYSVIVAFNYLTAKDISILAQIAADYPQYGFQVSDREISIFTSEGE